MTLATANRKEKEKKSEFRLKVEIENFGPINSGTITVKPLTLFIGPNNSGKSYAAMLIHSIFESYNPVEPPRFVENSFFLGEPLRFKDVIDMSIFTEELRNFLEHHAIELKRGEELQIPKELVESIAKIVFKEIYERRLSDAIMRSYASSMNNLIGIGKKSFTLKIGSNSSTILLKCQRSKLEILEYPQLNLDTFFIKNTKEIVDFPIIKKTKDRFLFEIPERIDEKIREFIPLNLVTKIFDQCIVLLSGIAIQCHYLPAARAFIMQGYKDFAASIIDKIPYLGIKDQKIPKFSGVVSSFMSSIINLQEQKGPFYELAQDLERELISGEVVLKGLDEYHREIMYKFHDVDIPLHRASSTVSELVPLFLYLKYMVTPNSVLIIEEPEAHLHPANQRILAKYLVRLVRKGVYVIATTHSDYFLEQIDNFVLLSQIDPEERSKKYKYNEDDFLKYDEVAVYEFHYDEATGGSKIEEAEITKEDGISQEEFVRILDELYEETDKLRSELDSE